MPSKFHNRFYAATTSLLLFGCASSLETSSKAEFADSSAAPASAPRAGAKESALGSLDSYVRIALANHPDLKANFEEWRASTHRISRARRLPEPTLSYAYFVRSIETRVGPQRHRIGVSQSFPWPSKLSHSADAASHVSRSARRRYEAAALDVMQRVTTAYWQVWLVERVREVQLDQQRLLEQLSGSARVRLEVGQGSLADVAQIDLRLSRMSDSLAGLDEAERRARAELVRSLGVEGPRETPVAKEPPRLLEPVDDQAELASAAQTHPRIQSFKHLAEAANEEAKSADAEALPSFTVGADYIVTGEAAAPNVPDSGKDAVIVMLGVKLPLWQGIYGDEVDEAHAREAALSAREASGRNDARAALTTALSEVADSARRAKLYEKTLLPQAQGALGSVLGGYQTDKSTVAAVLLAQNDLLELQLGLVRAQAEHGMAWAKLEAVVGRPVRARELR